MIRKVTMLSRWLPYCGLVLACWSIVSLSPRAAGAADLAAQRRQFQDAYRAFQHNDAGRGEALSRGLESYVLYPYLRYEMLRRRLSQTSVSDVRAFMNAGGGSYLGEQLRSDWLAVLAREQRWADFLADYRPQQDVGLQCLYLAARARQGADPALTEAIKALWLTGNTLPKDCDTLLDVLAASPLMTDPLIWQRLRLAMEAGNRALAGSLSKKLSPDRKRWADLWLAMQAKPAPTLARPELRQDTQEAREILRYGIARLARTDADQAAAQWRVLQGSHAFTGADKGRTAAELAVAAVRQDTADALALLDQVPPAYADDRVQRAQLEAGLEAQDWARIRRWTGQPASAGMEALGWRYWRARSLEETGAAGAARPIYAELARERDYYGLLSAGRLGQPYEIASRRLTVPAAELEAFNARPGIRRAREFLELGMSLQARREWYFEVSPLDAHGMAVAAVAAHQWQWYDRAIIAMAKAGEYDDLDIRYPIVYGDLINKYAAERDIKPAVMLSLIRAESAFSADARSPAGALGLMQLMPATGRHTARKIGLPLKSLDRLLHAEDNIILGSAYLQHVLEKFDGNLAMAAAAYNAGPRRVTRWQPKTDCIPTDMWVDMIPFSETRRYVRNVIFNTAVYETRLRQRARSAPQHLAVVHAGTMQGSVECGVGLTSNAAS